MCHGAVGAASPNAMMGLKSWACGAVGSALPWHGRGQGFESLQVHQIPFQSAFLRADSSFDSSARVRKPMRLTLKSLAFIVLMVGCLAPLAPAQSNPYKGPRTADGKPDMSG